MSSLPLHLLARLRTVREQRRVRRKLYEVEQREDAFLLEPGMGPAVFLTSDGRVLIDQREWDGDTVREATDDEACAAMVSAARKLELPELLDFLPPAPEGAKVCPTCEGKRWLRFASGTLRPSETDRGSLVCGTCWGRGWFQ